MSGWFVDYLTIDGLKRGIHTNPATAAAAEAWHHKRNRAAVAYEVTGYVYNEEQP